MSSWEDYRSTAKGFAMEMARVPGELSLVFGVFSLNPYLIVAGAVEMALALKFDDKAYDAFMDKRESVAAAPVSASQAPVVALKSGLTL